nr:hypothetical protein Q903MT_gene3564 [Picea sitchensis]
MPLAQELNMYLQLLQPLLLPLRVIPLLWMLLINQRVKLLVLLLELV